MNISPDILDQPVPQDMMPTRLDSALNLYTNIKHGNKTGILTYNVNPSTWNCLYSFYETNHKFTIDSYHFSNQNPTYRQLLAEYQQIYRTIYEENAGWTKTKRQEILVSEFVKTFGLTSTTIGTELTSTFELKFSKSKKVWTLYYFENYVASTVNDLNKLLNQTIYEQKILPLDPSITEIDGVTVASNIPYLLSNKDNIDSLNQYILQSN